MDCIFCNIVNGQVPSAKVYENEHVFAFLDISPVAEGHCLVIPKQHFDNIFDIDEAVLGHIMAAAKKIAVSLKNNLKASAVNVMHANGKEARQEVMHFHLHIVPRVENDGINFHHHGHQKPSFEELKEVAQRIAL